MSLFGIQNEIYHHNDGGIDASEQQQNFVKYLIIYSS